MPASAPAFSDFMPERPRVSALIAEAARRPLTAVVAGTGFGKALAVSSLYDTPGERVIWLQLTRLDNHAPRLWERLCDGIARHNQGLGADLKAMGFPETYGDSHLAFRYFEEAVAGAGAPVAVVFEDIDVIREKSVTDMIGYAASSRIEGLSIVLISDGDPPDLGLPALSEKGLLSSVTRDDLRMTPEEVADCFRRNGIRADKRRIHEIHDWTYGWPFAVYLAGLELLRGDPAGGIPSGNLAGGPADGSLAGGSPASGPAGSVSAGGGLAGIPAGGPAGGIPAGTAPFGKAPFGEAPFGGALDMGALIERELYAGIEPDAHKLLLYLSILESVPAPLMRRLAAETLTGGSGIDRRYHTLLSYEAQSGAYRVMPLYRDFILERHNDLTEAETRELYLRAARWYRESGDKLRAIHYGVAGGDYIGAFEIMLTHTRRLPSETAGMFIRLIDGAPPEAIEAVPVIEAARVRYLFNNREMARAGAELRRLRERYEPLPPSESRDAALGEVYLLSGIHCLIYKTLGFAELFRMADRLLPGGSQVVDGNLSLMGGASFMTNRDLGPGSLMRMIREMNEAAPYASRVMRGCGAGMSRLVEAEYRYMIGDMRAAEECAYAALGQAQAYAQLDIEYMAYFILLRVATFRGNAQKATELLATVEKYAKKKQTPLCGALCDIVLSGFYVPFGRADKVAPWILDESELARPLAPISLNRGQWIRARCLLTSGRYGELLGYLDRLDELYEVKTSLLGLTENAVMRAIARYYSGERDEALRALHRSYELSHENGIVMCHVEFGKWTRTLVRTAKLAKGCAIPQDWLDSIATKSSTYAKRLAAMAAGIPGLEEERPKVSLSKRERELLEGLCQGLTREELAETYGISINTVKRIIPAVYDKLGATNNLDAVRIATSLNLMD